MRGVQLALPMVVDEAPVLEWTGNRRDCADGTRPCIYVRCRYHVFVDVSSAGSLRHNGATLPRSASAEEAEAFAESVSDAIVEAEHTCTLDIALDGRMSWVDIGRLVGVTRQRAEQIGSEAMAKAMPSLSRATERVPVPKGHRVCRQCGKVYVISGTQMYCSSPCRDAGREIVKRGKGSVARRLPSGRVVRVLSSPRRRRGKNVKEA